MEELWKPIPDWEGYEVSTFGRVKSFRRGKPRILKPEITNRGYFCLCLSKGGKHKNLRVHRLVALVFIPNPENKPQINHRDGNKLNNHVENLEWVTPSENKRHAFDTGLTIAIQGEECSFSKLTNKQVSMIRDNPSGLTIYELADLFGIAFQTISKIQRGQRWKQAGGDVRQAYSQPRNKIPDEMRAQIRAEYVYGSAEFGCCALAKKYGVDPTTISRIVHEKERRRLS